MEGYKEQQQETMYHDLRNAYYTGCFAQVEKPKELYDKIIESIESKPQSGEEMFHFLKSMVSGNGNTQAYPFDSQFTIPLKLTPAFDVGVFSYIYSMDEDSLELCLPDVSLSLNGELLKPANGIYHLKPGLVKINYGGQVYTIMLVKTSSRGGR
ncbi:hypothetical protein DEAC_c23580 [Desulfosporosinus acididurans]|uniref:Uncharacterized protein n=1 Tax=Desulfosporosinus acididurans TaxID=476652 RepID=A0A0J1FRV2_9FIRM|nr:hypothetical protein [Desulfosporosinus acididurans]KLU65728.1 hypothetical protein DEAC_c23580 [Desulfosporosinus acididurans]